MVTIRKATKHNIQALSVKLLGLLEDETSQVYQDNVAKFGIPSEVVREAFSEKALLEVAASGKSTFYLALEDGREIVGFAQTVQKDAKTVELDRIVVFPEYARKGIGTRILNRVIRDARLRKADAIVVNAGKDEAHARRFYEKNGFSAVKEETVEYPWGSKITLVAYRLQLEHGRKPKANIEPA
jgi:ribosomal protein S18 acetylase RimI-like enzyme